MTAGLMRDLLSDPTAGVKDDKGVGALNVAESAPSCFEVVFASNDPEHVSSVATAGKKD